MVTTETQRSQRAARAERHGAPEDRLREAVQSWIASSLTLLAMTTLSAEEVNLKVET
jgi:hypothetical protein